MRIAITRRGEFFNNIFISGIKTFYLAENQNCTSSWDKFYLNLYFFYRVTVFSSKPLRSIKEIGLLFFDFLKLKNIRSLLY